MVPTVMRHLRERLASGRFDPFDLLDRTGRVLCLTVGGVLGIIRAVIDMPPVDAGMIWAAGHSPHYYGEGWSLESLYVYPPTLAQVVGAIPFSVFIVLWMVLVFGSLWYATRWLSAPILVVGAVAWALGGVTGPLASPLVLCSVGNPQAVVAAAIVLGFRRPAAWAFVLLTKIGPGVGLLWFAFRREWKPLAVALGTTFGIAAASIPLAPVSWGEFIRFALENYATPAPVPIVPVPLFIRLPMSVALIWWGARTDRPWTVLVGAGWAALALYQWSYLIPCLAGLVMLVNARRARADGGSPSTAIDEPDPAVAAMTRR